MKPTLDKHKEIEMIWNTYYSRVYGYFFRRISNREVVEDLTSETFLALAAKIDSTPIDDIPAYLWQIARNKLNEHYRELYKSTHSTISIDEIEDLLEKKHYTSTNELIQIIYSTANACLSEDEYTLFFEYYESSTSKDTISQRLLISNQTLRKRISRIKKILQSQLLSNSHFI